MRILLTIAEMGVGGAERMVSVLACALARRGDDVAVAAAPGPFDTGLPTNIERIVLPLGGRSLAAGLAGTHQLASAIRGLKPDVMHAHGARTTARAGAARWAAGRPRTPLLATYHGLAQDDQRIGARLFRAADEIVCVSEDLVASLRDGGWAPERIHVIANSVDVPPPLDPERHGQFDRELGTAGQRVVAIVGRLVPQKRHDRFLEAAALVEWPDTRFLVVGDGPLRGDLEALASDLGVAESVRFLGVRADARELMARADVVVFSSDSEGLSVAALESLAAGTPVVSTPVSGMAELLAGAGTLVESAEPGALARAIDDLLSDDARRLAMGDAGRDLVAQRYSLESMVDAHSELYGRLAARAD